MRFVFKLAFIALFISCSTAEKKAPDLMSCVPQNTLAVVQLNDQNMLKSALSSASFLTQIMALDPTLYAETLSLLPDQFPSKALLCFTPEGKSSIGVSFLYTLQPQDSLQLLEGETFEYEKVTVALREVNQTKIYQALLKGISISSSSRLIIENSIRNIQNNRLGIQEGILYDLAKISDENAASNLFIRKGFDQALTQYFPETPLFPFLGSSWYSFDFSTKKEPFALDGVSFINDSIPDKITLLKGQNPQRLLGPQVVPQNFDGYLGLSIADYKALEDQFKKYSRHLNIALNQIDFTLLSAVDEIGWIQLEDNQTVLFHLNNTEVITPELFSTADPQGSYRGVSLYRHAFPEAVDSLLNTLGTYKGAQWSLQLDDFLFYSNSDTHLKQIIGNYLDNQTLANDLNFTTLREDLADNSTFLWLGKTPNLLKKWGALSEERKEAWDKIDLEDFPLLVLQGGAEQNFIQTRLTAQKKNSTPEKNSAQSQYSFSLDAPASRAPQWIKNHRNKTMDVVVQDQNNVLYLFSNTGKLYWKKQLTGQIVGSIEQVDLYKNRRLQMAFRTADRFQILDRNGKIVAPFDIKLSGQDPNHLAVFDYDLNRNYRFLLVDGKKIQMLDNRGKTVSGFRLKTLDSELLYPPSHIRFGAKDYIVLQSKNGSIRILNRQGTDRIKLKEVVKTSENPVFEYRNTFAGTTNTGDMYQIDANGNVLRSSLGLGEDHQIDMSAKSLVSLDDNNLVIKGIPVSLPFGRYTRPKIHYIKNTIYVALTELDTQKVYVYLSNGNLVGGFPVYGTATADLNNADSDGAIEMVVQSESNGFIIYELN